MTNISVRFKIVSNKKDKEFLDSVLFALMKIPNITKSSPFVPEKERTIQKITYIPDSPSDSEDSDDPDDTDDEDYFPDNSTTSCSGKKIKRKNIPQKIRQMTWRQYIGSSMDGKCWSCGNPITFENWHAGHVKPHCEGGPDTVENLRPLCPTCNFSMGRKHMANYIIDFNMKGQGAIEFGTTNVLSEKLTQLTL